MFYRLQKAKTYLQTFKKMDFNFANCVKLAKSILFLGNFEKLKKQGFNVLQTLKS